jgi:excisionase family DNA binding protein
MTMLTVKEAAERIGCRYQWLQAQVRSGKVPATRKGPMFLIDPADLEGLGRPVRGRPRKAQIPDKTK